MSLLAASRTKSLLIASLLIQRVQNCRGGMVQEWLAVGGMWRTVSIPCAGAILCFAGAGPPRQAGRQNGVFGCR
jgi:hypothetical protein